MDINQRIALIKEVGEEILTEQELIELLETKAHPTAYDGMEPSGHLHIAQGTLRAININKMLKAGCRFIIWVADWFAWMNNKMGGDLNKIHDVGLYQIEVWKASGMQTDKVKFLWASKQMDSEYWKKVISIARNSTVQRITRCSQIMGRKESEMLSAAQIFYPCMQCADIFHLKADITQLGMDQRKVNVLAREIGPKLGFWKPVIVSHHMLMGLNAPPPNITDPIEKAVAMKMSKSIPDSAIFMTDSKEEVNRKISKAYCPEKTIAENPILEYCKYIIFEKFKEMHIERDKKYGGNLNIGSYNELIKLYSDGSLHPIDLKNTTAYYINEILGPVRKHFEKNKKARDLLKKIKGYETSR